MKRATPINKRVWLIVVLAMLVAMVCMFTACDKKPSEQPTETPVTSELYWNLDKALYTENSEIGLSTRERAADGLYHFRFATTGKLVELTTDDAQIVNFIDTMEIMGLILDDNGSIVDAIPVAELATEVAKEFFVKKVSGNNVQLNSSPAMNGMDVEIVLPETAYIMDARRDTETPAQAIELEVMDSVWVYADQDNVVTNVFVSKRPPESEFYVRMNRFYAGGQTTRVPDKDGIYTIPFAVNGQIVELKCKDKDMVSSIDSGTDTGAHMGLVFDEEGYIIEDMSGAESLRCAATAVVFHVKEINGDKVTFVRKLPGSNQGSEVTVTITPETQIINTELAYMSDSCWAFEEFGELTDHLEIDDRIICYADSDGNAKVITILCRMVDSKLYFNQSVMYNSTEKTTTRVPNEDGYYVYTFACEGKTVTLKTKSKKVATKVDSYTSGIVGLKLSGSIIKDACSPYCVAGWNVTAKLIAREMLGTVVTLTSRWDINNVGGNYVLADGCKTFDVTGNHGVKFGAKTTVQVGDHVYGVRNSYGDLAYIFVTKRLSSGTKLYYNTWRRYNTTTGETTRPADEEGYYVYDLLTETGKLVQGKTKDKKMADFIDKQLSPFVSLKINSKGIITKAAFCESSLQWGMKYTNYHYIAKIDYENKTYSTYYMSNGKRVESYQNVPFADDVKMYNFSTNYKDHRGEKTKVRVDDRVQAFYDAGQNKVSHIYVLERTDPTVKKYCPHCDKKVNFYGYKSGTAPAGETTHYYIANDRYLSQIAVGAKGEEKRTSVVLDLNGHVLNGSSSRVALVYGDLTVFDSKGGGGVTGNINGWGGAIMGRETAKINLLSGTYTYSSDEKYLGATVGGVIWLGEKAELNVSKDAKIVNGRTSGNGGLIYMEGSSVANINGAELGGGAAINGGNFYLTGSATLNIKDSTIATGTANVGANFYLASKTANFNLDNVTFDGGIAVAAERTYPITGTVNWTVPVMLRNGGKLDLTGMSTDSTMAVDAEGVFTTNFADVATAESYLGCFTVPQDYKPVYLSGKALATELELEAFINRETGVANAIKELNPADVVAGNTCPMCGAKNVTWVKKTGAYWASTKSHIYYEGAVGSVEEPIVAGNFIGAEQATEVCVVLVDADIHTTGRVLLRPNNIFSFMGTGKLTSTGESTGEGILRDRGVFNYVGAPIELNLYGGNYQYTGTGFGIEADNTPSATTPMYGVLNISAGSVANIFNDTVIGNMELDTSRTYYNVYTAGKLNMFGGSIVNGVSDTTAGSGNLTIAGAGSLNMYGPGVITGGVALGDAPIGANITVTGKDAVVDLGEAFPEGGIAINAATTLAVKGKVEWTKPVILRNGAKLDLTAMTTDSTMALDAEGIFTTDFADAATAETYLNCFTVPAGYKPVSVKGNALSSELEIEALVAREKAKGAAIAALNPADVIAGTTCPMCGAENVTWGPAAGTSVASHTYFSGAIGTAEEPLTLSNLVYNPTASGANYAGKTMCIVLVDADIHMTGRFLLRPDDVMNIMGTGTVRSNGQYTEGSTRELGLFSFIGSGMKLNLYGGNYIYTGTNPYGVKADGSNYTSEPKYALLGIETGAVANIYNDVVIGNPEKDTTRDYKNVHVKGTLNMFGGTIQNGVALTTEMGGNVCVVGGTVNMYDGLIQNGVSNVATTGGNVQLAAKSVFNMYGGTIKGGETTYRGGNILMLSNSTLNINGENALITEGKAIATGSQNSGGGNIGTSDYISNAVINMYAGTISKGEATATDSMKAYKGGGNIFGYGYSTSDPATFKINIYGGTVTGGTGPVGGNIYARNHTAVTVGKDAVISDGTATTGGNIQLFNQAQLVTEGIITNGTSVSGGGNINAAGHKTAGATYVTVNGGVISNGVTTGASGWGGNIRGYNAKITVNDGYIYGGSSVASAYHAGAANIGSLSEANTVHHAGLYINGGHIAGDIRTNSVTGSKTEVKLSGAPEIAMTINLPDGGTASAKFAGLYLQSGVVADISELLPEAKITVSVAKDQAFTIASGNATAVVNCFSFTNAALVADVTADGVLKAITAPVAQALEERTEAPAVVETPVVEAPVVEAPVVEAPVVETPVVEAPVVETPEVPAA